jgi:DNA repair exonuclease SbcCD ATPase subunit
LSKRRDLEVVITTRDELDKGLQQAANNVKQFTKTVDAALSAVAWGALTKKIVDIGDAATQVYTSQQRALSGLSSMATAFGRDADAAQKAAQDLAGDGILPLTTAASGLRNMLGELPLDQATQLMSIFMDRAAVGRAESVGFAQAVENLAESFKTESSELGNMSGMTENWSQIIEVGAQKLGKHTDELSKAERAQAKYLGVVELSRPYMGMATQATQGLAGAQMELESSTKELTASIGEALAPAVASYDRTAADAAKSVAEWVKQNQEAVRTTALMSGGAAGAVAGLTTLITTVRMLAAAAGGGWAGLALLAVTALGGAMGGYAAEVAVASEEAARQKEKLTGLVGEYNRLKDILDDSTKSQDDHRKASEELRKVLAELETINPDLVAGFQLQRDQLEQTNAVLDEQIGKWERLKEKALQAIAGSTPATWLASKAYGALTGSDKTPEEQAKDLLDKLSNEADMYRQDLLGQGVLSAAEIEAKVQEKYGPLIRAAQGKWLSLQGPATTYDPENAIQELGTRPAGYVPPGPNTGGGDTGGTKLDPYRDALRYVDHLKAMGQLTAQQEIAMLEQVRSQHASTAEQIMDIDERIYKAKAALSDKEKSDAEAERAAKVEAATKLLDHQLRMNQIGTAAEIKSLQEILSTYQLTAEERMAIEERLQEAQQRYAAEIGQQISDQMKADQAAADQRVRNALAAINHQERMGQLSKEQEIASLEEHLQKESQYYKEHADERWAIEERIYGLKDQIRQDDLQKEKEAQQKAAEAREKAEQKVTAAIQSLRALLRQEEEQDLAAVQKRQKSEESAIQSTVDGLREQLNLLEQQNREEDRAIKLAELRAKLKQAQDSGPLEEFITADGRRIWRNAQAEELQQQLADAERDNAREQERQKLQDRIDAAQAQLDAMRNSHQQELDARRQFWTDLLGLDDTQLANIVSQTEAQMGTDGWYGTMEKWLSQAATITNTKVSNITSDLARVVSEVEKAQTSLLKFQAMEAITVPAPVTIPATAGSSSTVGDVTVINNVNGASDPAATAQAVGAATAKAGQQVMDWMEARAAATLHLRSSK